VRIDAAQATKKIAPKFAHPERFAYLCASNTGCLKGMKNKVNLNTLRLTYPLPALLRGSFISKTVNKLLVD
jgi:hypothetical protein